MIEHFKKEGIEFNIGENISNWGVIPLPEGYRGRAILVHKGEYLVVKVLEPLDFIFSKLLRGTEEDFMDIVRVAKRYQISKEKIIEREKMIRYPKDPETLFFKRKLDHLLSLIN